MLGNELDMKDLCIVKNILGMEIHKDMSSRKLCLSQKSYVEKVLDKFDMSSLNSLITPLSIHFKISLDQSLKTDAEAEYMSKVPYSKSISLQVDF